MEEQFNTQPNTAYEGWQDIPAMTQNVVTKKQIQDSDIDNSSGSNVVTLTATQTLENKTIDFLKNNHINLASIILQNMPVGYVIPQVMFDVEPGYLSMDGSTPLRATYPDLFNYLNPRVGTVTMTVASPAVVTLTAHGLLADDAIFFTTTGALPTGVTANTLYYVLSTSLTSSTFRFSLTRGGAAINSSGTQSGVHSVFRSPHGIGNGSTTFTLPDMRKRALVGYDTSDTLFDSIGMTGGATTVTLTTAQLAVHTHIQNSHNHSQNAHSHVTYTDWTVQAGGGATVGGHYLDGFGGSPNVTQVTTATNVAATATNQNAGGGEAHPNMGPYLVVRWQIKY